MITDLSSEEFLKKLEECSQKPDAPKPIEVRALRHVVPVFVQEEGGMALRQAVVAHLSFEYGGDEYRTREQVLFNKYNEADLTTLRSWQTVVKDRIAGVQPIVSHRTGSL